MGRVGQSRRERSVVPTLLVFTATTWPDLGRASSFDPAKHRLSTLLTSDPPTALILRQKLAPLQTSLLACLCYDLSSPTLRKTTLTHLVQLFTRLEQPDLARATFLKARTEVMRKRVRTIKFEGDIPLYVNELAVVSFMGVKHTSDWYLAGFKESGMASGQYCCDFNLAFLLS